MSGAKSAPELVLASGSPRRKLLLSGAGFEFRIVSPQISEQFDSQLTIGELTTLNAVRKGIAVSRRHPKAVVLSADTLVAIENSILGKPRDHAEAMAMLRQLRGRVHQVCSSVFICHFASGKSRSFCEISHVQFRQLSDTAIFNYFKKVNPLDKAGGYAAQGFGREIIAKINGSFSNVVGLPMEQATTALAEFGIQP